MRFLLISIYFILVSCGSYPKNQNFHLVSSASKNIVNPYFSDESIDYVYKTSIDIYNNSFGGLLIIKKVDKQEHRIAFTTEMGNKLFDFSFNGDSFKVNYILDELNKKILINMLNKDFKVLITENLHVSNSFTEDNNRIFESTINNKKYYYYFNKNQLTQVVRANNGKEKVAFLFLEISDNIAEQISIKHNNIKLEINLKSITQ
ncbi:hypothetical protein [Formosa maritima]|uniref:DUF4292 domain-containing protein n=1 Tax=Formosa maritima TaxID=2592046 RepID=A0A5D0G1A8_9FLAO|nr:hypothetical protein [Formosa maritima]TYA52330.1 hypothetical protein FVF61_13390 [Formosa maritima]